MWPGARRRVVDKYTTQMIIPRPKARALIPCARFATPVDLRMIGGYEALMTPGIQEKELLAQFRSRVVFIFWFTFRRVCHALRKPAIRAEINTKWASAITLRDFYAFQLESGALAGRSERSRTS